MPGAPLRAVVVDTSVFVSDFNREGNDFVLLMRMAGPPRYQLVVPKVVFDELVNKYREEVSEKSASMLSSRSKFLRFVRQPIPKDPPPRDYVGEYRTTLTKALEEVDAEIPGYPKLSHQEVTARILARRKPSVSKDEGYRDTLIWESILEVAAQRPVAFITLNKRDFADSQGGLHPDLKEDLNKLGLTSDRVELFTSLRAFLDVHVQPDLDALAMLSGLLLTGPRDVRSELQREIGKAVEAHFEARYPIEYSWPHLDDVSEVEVTHVDPPSIGEISITEARVLTNREWLFEGVAETSADVEFFISKADLWTVPDHLLPEIWDSDWNDHVALAHDRLPIRLVLQGSFDPVSQTVHEPIVWDFEVVE